MQMQREEQMPSPRTLKTKAQTKLPLPLPPLQFQRSSRWARELEPPPLLLLLLQASACAAMSEGESHDLASTNSEKHQQINPKCEGFGKHTACRGASCRSPLLAASGELAVRAGCCSAGSTHNSTAWRDSLLVIFRRTARRMKLSQVQPAHAALGL